MKLIETGHYHGDIVRRLFIIASIIILLSLPLLQQSLPAPLFASIIAIIVVNFFAGFTSPIHKNVVFFDTLVSVLGLIVFEYEAVLAYNPEILTLLFSISQLLALVFFFAFYYSVKTLRGMMLE